MIILRQKKYRTLAFYSFRNYAYFKMESVSANTCFVIVGLKPFVCTDSESQETHKLYFRCLGIQQLSFLGNFLTEFDQLIVLLLHVQTGRYRELK